MLTRRPHTHIMRTELDRIAENEYARKEGYKEGEAAGMAKGKEELAKRLLRMGVSPETITGEPPRSPGLLSRAHLRPHWCSEYVGGTSSSSAFAGNLPSVRSGCKRGCNSEPIASFSCRVCK